MNAFFINTIIYSRKSLSINLLYIVKLKTTKKHN